MLLRRYSKRHRFANALRARHPFIGIDRSNIGLRFAVRLAGPSPSSDVENCKNLCIIGNVALRAASGNMRLGLVGPW